MYLSCSCTATTHLQELPEVTSLLIAGSFQTWKKLAIVDHLIRTQHSCAQVQKLVIVNFRLLVSVMVQTNQLIKIAKT